MIPKMPTIASPNGLDSPDASRLLANTPKRDLRKENHEFEPPLEFSTTPSAFSGIPAKKVATSSAHLLSPSKDMERFLFEPVTRKRGISLSELLEPPSPSKRLRIKENKERDTSRTETYTPICESTGDILSPATPFESFPHNISSATQLDMGGHQEAFEAQVIKSPVAAGGCICIEFRSDCSSEAPCTDFQWEFDKGNLGGLCHEIPRPPYTRNGDRTLTHNSDPSYKEDRTYAEATAAYLLEKGTVLGNEHAHLLSQLEKDLSETDMSAEEILCRHRDMDKIWTGAKEVYATLGYRMHDCAMQKERPPFDTVSLAEIETDVDVSNRYVSRARRANLTAVVSNVAGPSGSGGTPTNGVSFGYSAERVERMRRCVSQGDWHGAWGLLPADQVPPPENSKAAQKRWPCPVKIWFNGNKVTFGVCNELPGGYNSRCDLRRHIRGHFGFKPRKKETKKSKIQ